MSKILFISTDQELSNSLEKFAGELGCGYENFNSSNDPLDIISEVLTANTSLLVLDDDFLNPESAKILESVKKVKSKLPVLFFTSNTSIQLGREINGIGVKFYLIKPVVEENLREFIKSVKAEEKKHIY